MLPGHLHAAARPDVTTGSASNVTDTGARIAGVVSPHLLDTSYHVEYGTTASYGQQTTDVHVTNFPTQFTATLGLTGLAPNTLYHYRSVATNASGTTAGADQTFRTTGPPSLNTAGASAVTTNAATLTGAVNANGHDTMYRWEYGTTTSYGSQTRDAAAGSGTSEEPVTATLTGLAARTVFHYRLVATNASGTTDGPDHALQTAPPPPAGGGGGGSREQPSSPGAVKTAKLTVRGTPRVVRNAVSVTVACAVADCRVSAVLTARLAKRHSLVIGGTRAVLRASTRRTITIALNPAGRRLQSRHARVPATLVLSLAGPSAGSRSIAVAL